MWGTRHLAGDCARSSKKATNSFYNRQIFINSKRSFLRNRSRSPTDQTWGWDAYVRVNPGREVRWSRSAENLSTAPQLPPVKRKLIIILIITIIMFITATVNITITITITITSTLVLCCRVRVRRGDSLWRSSACLRQTRTNLDIDDNDVFIVY